MKIDSPDNKAITVSASSKHLCSTDARITLVNRGSNGKSDIVRPSVVNCGGDPFRRDYIRIYCLYRNNSHYSHLARYNEIKTRTVSTVLTLINRFLSSDLNLNMKKNLSYFDLILNDKIFI